MFEELAKSTPSGLSSGGQNALWLVFAIQGIAAIVYGFTGLKLPSEKRDHFYVTTIIVTTAALSYFAMATGQGQSEITIAETGESRAIFWARYLDWSVTTPLLLVDVLLLAKLPLANSVWVIFLDLAMIVTGLIGALVEGNSRYYWFFFGCVFMVGIFASLFLDGVPLVKRRDSSLLGLYNSLVLALVILWTAYPIVWIFGEGLNKISPTTEAYLYGILDVTAKVGFGGVILYNNDKLVSSYGKGGSDAEAPLLQDG